MQKKKILILGLASLLLIFFAIFIKINFKNYLIRYYIWQGNYTQAIHLFPNNKTWDYNKANFYYTMKDYKNALKFYQKAISSGENLLNYYIFHNLWNTYYRIWENIKDSTKKTISNWVSATLAYKKAIKIWEKIKVNKKDLEETKKNLEFVLKKIDELMKSYLNKPKNQTKKSQKNKNNSNKQQQNNQAQENNQKGNNSQQNNQNQKDNNSITKSNKSWGSQKQSNKDSSSEKQEKIWINQQWKEKNKTNNKNWNQIQKNRQKDSQSQQNNQNQSLSKNSSALSEQSHHNSSIDKALEQYEKQLLQQQKQLMQNYWKVYQEKPQNPFNDPFFDDIQDPFFEDLPFNRENKVKDW